MIKSYFDFTNHPKCIKICLYATRRDEPMFDNTQKFVLKKDQDDEMKFILTEIYDALKSKGYNPISQIVGYILSEDPTYITNHNNARSLVRKLDRDELLHTLVRHYLSE